MDIDWSRVAEPQADQYDTEVILRHLRQSRPQQNLAVRNGAPAIFEGSVEVRVAEGPYARMENVAPASPSDERIHVAESYVRYWPEAFEQFKSIMHIFYPIRDVTGARVPPGGKGSISHSFGSHIGTMCATVEDPISLAQAFVHEMAHNKLRALGIMVESTRGFITNNPEDLYPSPVLTGVQRPMTAVFHAEYSFIYVTQLDLKILAARPTEETENYVRQLLERNVSRMHAGFETIQEHIQTDSIGGPFVNGFMDWAKRVIDEGFAVLRS